MMATAAADFSKTTGRRRRRTSQDQLFSTFLTFGHGPTMCMAVFLVLYALVLLFASPLLYQEVTPDAHMTRGQVLKPVVKGIKEKLKHLPGAAVAGAGALKKQLESLRKESGVTDNKLILKAQEQLFRLRKAREDLATRERRSQAFVVNSADKPVPPGKRPGFIVLGMHRSGTSMLSGLLVNGLGYEVGGPLIDSKFDNEKGFFELIDAVLQNDEFLNLQHIDWSYNVYNYDYKKALAAKEGGDAKFVHGKRALAFFNNAENIPWLQKDPRMCITLKTWLSLISGEPAVLWTYRNPMEVAHSLMAREASFTLDHALRLWIVYNIRGLQNSEGLCRVYTNNDAILADPLEVVQRLSNDLTNKCGVHPPPNKLSPEEVAKFVDTSLQHNKKKVGEDLPVIDQHGDCKVHDFVTKTATTDPKYQLEKNLYLIAMKLYCDMGSEAAYKDGYHWPDLEHL